MHNLVDIMASVNGASFIGLDTEVAVKLAGGKSNEFQGRVTKRTTGSRVMVFQNKHVNAYEAMVNRRLIEEGFDPNFEVGPRAWGTRIPNTPFIKHEKTDKKTGITETKYYLEVIFLSGGESTYFLDGNDRIPNQLVGMLGIQNNTTEGEQGGLGNKVIIRTYSVDSIVGVRFGGTEYYGKFEVSGI